MGTQQKSPDAASGRTSASSTWVEPTMTANDVFSVLPTKQGAGSEDANGKRRREELATFIVHDLKGPLNAMFLLTRLLSQEPGLSAEGRRDVKRLQTTCESMKRLVMNLLDLGCSADGQLVPHLTEVDASWLLGEVLDSMSFRARERHQCIDLLTIGDVPPVRADAYLLRRLVENLLDNALKYAPPGSVVTLELSRAGARHMELCVCDEGPTLSAEERGRLFRKYARLDLEKYRRTSRGLGLLFCRLAAEAHDGQIRVEPNVPTGNRFCVTLPIAGPSDTSLQHDA